MTTIAALVLDGVVHVAADSCNNVYDRPIIGGAQKIIVKRTDGENVLLAVCGNGGLMAIIREKLDVENTPADYVDDSDKDDAQTWANKVAFKLTDLAVEAGLTSDGKLDGTVLLGWNGQLWSLTHMQAIPHPDGIAALGSGEGPAIGAIDALQDRGDGKSVVIRAAEIAIERDRYSRGPVQYETV